MRYIISDVHGCYDQLMELLEKIGFNSDDKLYFLGDAIDRGPKPIKVLKFFMSKPNVNFIMGNHDNRMLSIFDEILSKYNISDIEDILMRNERRKFVRWIRDGGAITIDQFLDCTTNEQKEILNYLVNASLYKEIAHEGNRYILVHAGIANYEHDKSLELYSPVDFIYERTNYRKPIFNEKNTYLVTGHTPTELIREDGKPLIYKGCGHIAVDCGCVYGGNLAAYCIETGEEFYVDGLKQTGKEDED